MFYTSNCITYHSFTPWRNGARLTFISQRRKSLRRRRRVKPCYLRGMHQKQHSTLLSAIFNPPHISVLRVHLGVFTCRIKVGGNYLLSCRWWRCWEKNTPVQLVVEQGSGGAELSVQDGQSFLSRLPSLLLPAVITLSLHNDKPCINPNMLLVPHSGNTKWGKKPEIWLKLWNMTPWRPAG